jgi:hypothetical protein
VTVWVALSCSSGYTVDRESQRRVLRMEFKTFINALIRLPCQIVSTGRRIVYRLLGWNRWLDVFFRCLDSLRRPLRC